jgi:hypothetical protein
MQCTLAARSARGNSRRYEFRYAERVRSLQGDLMLYTFYGPLRSSKQRYRTAREDEIEIVHTKTRHVAEEISQPVVEE